MGQELAVMQNAVELHRNDYTPEQVALIKRTICKGATDDELALFVQQCKRTGLDPFSKQIYAIKRWNSDSQREEMSFQTGIDGFRLTAERTGKYEGQLGPFWCGRDGVWIDVWVDDEAPVAAKVGALKTGSREPFWGIARWKAYVQTKKSGEPTRFWAKMDAEMLAKCAEALALRKAFPQELSGLYTREEMQQADSEDAQEAVAQRRIAQVKATLENMTEAPSKPNSKDTVATFKAMLAKFAELKARVGNETYYRILGMEGYEHANQIPSLQVGRRVYREIELAADDRPAPQYEATDDDVPAEIGGAE